MTWRRGSRDGFDEAHQQFLVMLDEARQALEAALAARLGRADAAASFDLVADLEQRADAAEIRLRQRLLVHATVHGATDIPACLRYMSIGKDAERISDLALGLCHITARSTVPDEPVLDDLTRLGESVVAVLRRMPDVISDEDGEAARALIKEARAVQQGCAARLDDVLRAEAGEEVLQAGLADIGAGASTWDPQRLGQPVALALTYRHLGRVAANALNILSSVVVPLDHLDYPTGVE